MPLLVAKAHHLVLDRWTIARPAALNDPGVHRRTVNPAANNFVRQRVGVSEMAPDLFLLDPSSAEGKGWRRIISGLKLQLGIVDTAAVQARAGAGLKPPDTETELRQMVAQAHRGEIARAPSPIILEPNMDQAFEERAGSQNHAFGLENLADLRLHAAHAAALD